MGSTASFGASSVVPLLRWMTSVRRRDHQDDSHRAHVDAVDVAGHRELQDRAYRYQKQAGTNSHGSFLQSRSNGVDLADRAGDGIISNRFSPSTTFSVGAAKNVTAVAAVAVWSWD